MSFLLDYDTGTEHLPVLAGKLEGYQVLAAGLAWHGEVCPVLLFCFGSPRREQAACRALAASQDATALRIATTAIDRVSPVPPGRSGCRSATQRAGAAGRPGGCAARPLAEVPGAAGTRTPRGG